MEQVDLPAEIIKKLKDEGKVLVFVDYKKDYSNAIFRGWEPLDPRKYPELLNQEEGHHIKRGDQIAMIRDRIGK